VTIILTLQPLADIRNKASIVIIIIIS